MPTVVIGNNTGDDYSGTEDVRIDSDDPTINYGAEDKMEFRQTSGRRTNGLLRFTGLSNISSSATLSAFTVYLHGSNPWESMDYHFRRLLRSWVEGSQSYGYYTSDTPHSSCWTQYGNDNAWTTSGGLSDGNDRVAAASGAMAIDTNDDYYSLSSSGMLADAQGMVDGTYTNNGWIITRDTVDSWHVATVVSSEGTDGSRPYITVTYTESSGTSGNSYYYQQQQV